MTAAVRVIAVVGMVREARIIAGDGVLTVIGGGDSAGLERKLEEALADLSLPVSRSDTGEVARRERAVTEGVSPRAQASSAAGSDGPPPDPPFFEQGSRMEKPLLLSFGVCGALVPGLEAGDLLIASEVIADGHVHAVDADWTAHLAAALPKARLAPITAGEAMIGSVAGKRALFEATGAAAVDMESHIVARVAQRHALPFAAIRAVSDAADHALPAAALAGLRPDGQPDIGAVLWSLAKRPGQLPALLRTAREAGLGFKSLEDAKARLSRALATAG
ncbi:MAG TPA: hypothetical protein VGI79_03370 [Caulobacteraceae bacterium]|jgi:hopanoid-associated phosphorylase